MSRSGGTSGGRARQSRTGPSHPEQALGSEPAGMDGSRESRTGAGREGREPGEQNGNPERRKGAGGAGKEPRAKEGSRQRTSVLGRRSGAARDRDRSGQTAAPRARRAAWPAGRSCRASGTEIKLRLVSVREPSVTGTFVFAELGGADADLLRAYGTARLEDASQLSGRLGEGETGTAHGHWALAAPSQPALSDCQRF